MPGKVLRADFFLISEGDFHSLRTLKKESYPCSASKDISGERPGDLPLDGHCFHRLGLPTAHTATAILLPGFIEEGFAGWESLCFLL